ncbi:T9SS type A sorting domain-containing protein [candidate division KSB1 bacterium]|nr:T9SS type A sorting domain-containing protein [candidate division KSB1 bacterium]
MRTKLVIFTLIYIIQQSYASTFYVDQRHPYAGDSNPGTRQLPWLSLEHAAKTAAAGDTVLVTTGVFQEQVRIKNSGTAEHPIVFQTIPSAEVIIDGSQLNIPEWQGLVDLSEKNHIIFSGFHVQNSATAGIFADEASHLVIRNNYISDTASSGIGIWNSEYISVEGNEVRRACFYGRQECITISNSAYFEIYSNHIYESGPGNRGGEGIDIKDGCRHGRILQNHIHDLQQIGIYVDAWKRHTYHIEISRNRIHDCEGFALASEAGGLLEDVRFFNNIVYHNQHCGLVIGSWGDVSGMSRPIKNIRIINNTFVGNGWNEWGGGINVENPEAKKIIIRNNIFSNNLAFQIANEANVPETELIVENNLIDGFRDYAAEITGDKPVFGNPRFVNRQQHSFILLPDSPAIDRGSPEDAPPDDYCGTERPQGSAVDIGAFEYTDDVGIHNFDSDSDKPSGFQLYPNYPNPFNSTTTFSFYVQAPLHIKLIIYNIKGQAIDELFRGDISRGFHDFTWQAGYNIASGVYIYRLESSNEFISAKCIYLK